MKSSRKLFTALAVLALTGASHAFAAEMACGSTGGMNRCPLAHADKLHVKVQQVIEGKCVHEKGWWVDSDGIVVDQGCNAVFEYKVAKAAAAKGTDANASAYYDDGCKAGAGDKKAGLSMAYQRHDGSYDSANAGTYEAGYNKCWTKAKK